MSKAKVSEREARLRKEAEKLTPEQVVARFSEAMQSFKSNLNQMKEIEKELKRRGIDPYAHQVTA